MQQTLKNFHRQHNSAIDNVVNCRAYYLALSAVCDQVYRNLETTYTLSPRLLPHAVYQYNLQQIWQNNTNNDVKLSEDVFEQVKEHMNQIALLGPSSTDSVLCKINNNVNLGKVKLGQDMSQECVQLWMNVCGEGDFPNDMQRSVNRTVSKKYLKWANRPSLSEITVCDPQTLAIAQKFQLANSELQNRIISPAVYKTVCDALEAALQERNSGRDGLSMKQKQAMLSLMQIQSEPRKSLIYTALGNPTIESPNSDPIENGTAFLHATDITSTGYNQEEVTKLLIQNIFTGSLGPDLVAG